MKEIDHTPTVLGESAEAKAWRKQFEHQERGQHMSDMPGKDPFDDEDESLGFEPVHLADESVVATDDGDEGETGVTQVT